MTDDQITETTYTQDDIERAQQEIQNLTPQTYLSLESAINASQDVIPEAGGIAFTEFVGKHGGIMHVTARATHPTRAAQMLLEALDYLRSLQPEIGWKVEGGTTPNVPVSSVQQPAPTEPQYVDIEEMAGAPPPAQPPAGEYTMTINKIEVTPKPDGRVDLSLFAPGHKWPDLRINNWPIQSVLDNVVDGNLNWTPDTLAAARILQGNMKVRWAHSEKLNTKGEPYKDVKFIGLA